MDEELNIPIPKPIFKNQPILCPWISSQPYPSSQFLKNKLNDLANKNYNSALNSSANTTVKKSNNITDYSANVLASPQQPSSTHFFYFLRLMQLFPDTHPATLHTVLTLSRNNFFFAIDKLLYAQKCKNDLGRKLSSFTGKGRGYLTNNRGRPCKVGNTTTAQRYQNQALSRTVVSADLAEVQRIIDLASEKPYLHHQTDPDNSEISNQEHQMLNICVTDDHQELVHGTQTYMDAENNEVIQIVCFDNDQTILKHEKDDQDMEIENFHENNVMVSNNIEDEANEPPVIVVDTLPASDTDEDNKMSNC